MAQVVTQVPIQAPGFQGLNNEFSPVSTDTRFALVADNVEFDSTGRLVSRRAYKDDSERQTNIDPVDGKIDGYRDTVFQLKGVLAKESYEEEVIAIVGHHKGSAASILRRDPNGEGFITLAGPFFGDEARDYCDAVLVPFQYKMYVFARNHDVLVIDPEDWSVTNLSEIDGYFGPSTGNYIDPDGDLTDESNREITPLVEYLDGNIAIAAYGRLWVTGVEGDYETIYVSSLLNPLLWYDATPWFETQDQFNTGAVLGVREVWPLGQDRIVGLHAHNGFLFCFGRNSTIVYEGVEGDIASENGARVKDSIPNLGLVFRDAVCNIGTDVLFLDDSGVRTLGRAIQERSNPIADASINIRTTITRLTLQEQHVEMGRAAMFYDASKMIAVLSYYSRPESYVFHTGAASETGGLKVVTWTGRNILQGLHINKDTVTGGECTLVGGVGTQWVNEQPGAPSGSDGGTVVPTLTEEGQIQSFACLWRLEGYDEEGYYKMRYESVAVPFSQWPSQTAIPKSTYYVVQSQSTPTVGKATWGFGNKLEYSDEFDISIAHGRGWGISEFGYDSFGPTWDGTAHWFNYKVNTCGSGSYFRVGLELEVRGDAYALQEITVNGAVGRIAA